MKTARTALFLGVLVSSLALGRASLHAQPASAQVSVDGNDKPWNRGVPLTTREAAKDLFLEGNRLFNIPVYTRAAEKYLAALAMWKHPAFHFNLAITQLNLGQDVEARDSLEQAVRHGEEPLGPEQFKEARRQLHDVESHLGRIQISCQTQGAEVTLDGATLFTGPGSHERWVKVSTHEVTVKKPGYLSEARRVTVLAAKRHDIDLRLITLDEAADTGRRWATWKPRAVVAAGGAIAAASGVLHALAFRNFSSYDKGFSSLDCTKSIGCTKDQIGPTLNAQLSLATREQQFAVGGYIAGGSVVAAGVLLLYLNRPHVLEERASSSPAVVVSPTLSAGGFGIAVSVDR